MKIVQLPTKPVRVCTEAVHLLEQVLEEARAGNVTGVGVAIVRPDGSITTAWSSSEQAPTLLGAISKLHHNYNVDLLSLDE